MKTYHLATLQKIAIRAILDTFSKRTPAEQTIEILNVPGAN
jgi:hypothetical protein